MDLRFAPVPFFTLFTLGLSACGGGSGGSGVSAPVDLELSASNIELDPQGVAPLSARLSFVTPEPGILSIRIKPKGDNGVDLSHVHEDEVDGLVEHPVLGLYANHVNEIIVELAGSSGQVYQGVVLIATQALPFGANPEIEIVRNEHENDDNVVYMFSRQYYAFDARGEIRWLYLGNAYDLYRKLPNGNLLATVDENRIYYHSPKFSEINMLGETTQEYLVDNYIHHEVRQLPWGNYLVAGNSTLIGITPSGTPVEDVVLEVEAGTGAIVKTWDFNTILEPARPPIPSSNNADDWLHLNSAVYDETDNSLYITGQRQSLVAKVDYATGALIWILGAHESWGTAFQTKLLSPVDATGEPVSLDEVDFWPYGPHAVLPLGAGRLALYDNGSFRGWYRDNDVPEESYSRAVEYQVDEENMTVQLIWEFTADKQIFTPATGDIDTVEQTDSYLIGFAGRSADAKTPRLVEVTRSGDIIFEAVSQLGTQDYRMEKFDLYSGL
jgi:arylsulfate sulfotransferase